MQLSDYASALAAAQRLVPDWREGDMQEAQLATARAQPQLMQAQASQMQAQTQLAGQEAAYKDQRRTLFQTAVASLGTRPTADKLYQVGVQFPEFAQHINEAAKSVSFDQRTAMVRQWAPLQALIQNGNLKGAIGELDRHTKAAQAQGLPDDEHTAELRTMLESGDPKQAKTASAILYGLISAVNPDTAAANIGKRLDSGTHVVSAGGALVADDGTELYSRAPAEANALEVPMYDADGKRIGTQLVANGGRSGAASGGSPHGAPLAGRTTGGWTPRSRNGGDNDDAAVDGKISGMSSALGIDPTAPFPPGTTNMQIAQALTLSEGGKGSIADRNNNPGNLTDPKTGAYRKFATKEAGLQAAAAQVARNRSRGQNTIQTMVEGLPVDGGAGASAAAGSGAPGYFGPVAGTRTGSAGDPTLTGDAYLASVPAHERAKIKAIAEGRVAAPRPGTRFGETILSKVAQYDPTFDAANSQSRLKTRTDFTSGKSAQAVNALNTAMGHLLHLDTQAKDLGNFSTLPGLLNPIYNKGRQIGGDTKLPAFQQTKQAASSEMRKVFAGSAGGNLTELKEWQESLDSSQSYEQLHAAIRNGVELMGSRLNALQDQYQTGMGRSDQPMQLIKPGVANATRKRFGIDLGGHGSSSGASAARSQPSTPSRFRILKVRPK